jgi:membrane protein
MTDGAQKPGVLRQTGSILRETVADWSEDGAPQLAAALSYYTIFSLAPLLVVIISVAGLVFGREAVQGELVSQIEGLVGRQGGQAIEKLIGHAYQPAKGVIAAVIGMAVLLLGATGVLIQLQNSLNTIWEVTPPPRSGVWAFVRTRLLSFVFVLGIGFLLLVSLVISATLNAIQGFASGMIPGGETLWLVVNFAVSIALVSLLFALMFKFLPDTSVAWSDVWVGAVMTALLFTIGKFLVGLYLGRAAVGSAYGAAGSLVIILVWVYYSAQILFFGAELTQVYARKLGSRIGGTGRRHVPTSARPSCPRIGLGQTSEL